MNALDEVFELFSRKRRRFALYYLDEADGAVHKDELAEQVKEWESDPASTDVPDDQFENMKLALEHFHLPKIKDVECIEYDREGEQLRIPGMATEAELLLSVTRTLERPSESAGAPIGDYV